MMYGNRKLMLTVHIRIVKLLISLCLSASAVKLHLKPISLASNVPLKIQPDTSNLERNQSDMFFLFHCEPHYIAWRRYFDG